MRPFSTLCQDLELLPKQTQSVRLTVRDFLQRSREHHRAMQIRNLRRFAVFLVNDPDLWPEAVETLLQRNASQANATVERYARWVERAEPAVKALGPGRAVLLSLSRFARRKTVIDWEIFPRAAERRQRAVRRSCPELLRLSKEWFRIARVRNLAPSTIDRQWDTLICLGQFLKRHRMRASTLDLKGVLLWIEEMQRSALQPSTINHRVQEMRQFYQWMGNQELIRKSPFLDIRPVRGLRKLPAVLSQADVLLILRATKDRRTKAILEVFYATGCRLTELCNLSLTNLSLQSRTAKVVGKGPQERILHLNHAAVRAIRKYLPDRERSVERAGRPREESLFVTCRGEGVRPSLVQVLVSEAGRVAGLAKRVTPHIFRHSFATHLLDNGADLYSLMHLMGHKSLQSTERYLQVATVRLGEVYDRCHPRS